MKLGYTFDFFDLHTKKWAPQDKGGAYFDEPKAKQDETQHTAHVVFSSCYTTKAAQMMQSSPLEPRPCARIHALTTSSCSLACASGTSTKRS